MKTRKIDILFIQESKIPTNSFFPIGDDHLCVTSTDVVEAKKPKEFKMKVRKGKGNAKGNGRGKGKRKGKKGHDNQSTEADAGVDHHGVAVIYRKK